MLVLALAIAAAGAPAIGAQTLTGAVNRVTVARGDTLRKLGSRFGVDPRTIAADNGLSFPATLKIGDALAIDNRHIVPAVDGSAAIVVNVPQRMLFLVTEGGLVAFPAAVGRSDWQTPLGGFTIASQETNPTWDVPASIRAEAERAGRTLPLKVPPGPNNPLGAYWLGLSVGGVGIHGTNAPSSVYQVVTHGCIRLHPEEIATLFTQVRVGTPGQVVYQPLLIAADGDDVLLEVHGDVYGRGPGDPVHFVKELARERGVFERIDWNAAETVIQERAGVARVVTRR